MLRAHFKQTNAGTATLIEPGKVTQHLAIRSCRGLSLTQGLVELFEAIEERLRVQRAKRFGHEAFDLHFLATQREACVTRDYQKLTRHVFARKIGARIRLGETEATRIPKQGGERTAAVVLIEQPGERAGVDTFQ